MCESSQVLLEAPSAEDAYEKSRAWARRHEEDSAFRFVGVRHLHSLDEPPGDGVEIGGGFFEEEGVWQHPESFVPPKNEIPVIRFEANPDKPIRELVNDEAVARLRKLFP